MNTNTPSNNPNLYNLPNELKDLGEIALNIWWTFNPRGKNLFKTINPYLWKAYSHNPIKLLKNLSQEDLQKLLKNNKFMKEYKYVSALYKSYINDNAFKHENRQPLAIAYFCAEYGLHHSLPIYSGGLGFLAGDLLKEASDMNLPIVGVGFMYPQGYVRQIIGSDGWQNGTNETIIKDEAPIEKVYDKNGKHLTIQVPFIDPPIYVAIWKVNVGRVTLYLLDTDIEQNDPWDRQISSRLYTPDMNQRLRQEIVLGVGGYRVLEVLGIKYSILHLNEGHPAFALFERIRSFMQNKNISFEEAVKKVKETSIFTTHTPLQAATDIYNFDMINNYFKDYYKSLNISKEDFLNFGVNPDNPSSGFNMTVLAFNLCKYKNAVSKKHQSVTQSIWQNLLKKLPKEESFIDYVTNGVHLSTWMNEQMIYLLDEYFGEWTDIQNNKDLWEKLEEIDEKTLWDIHHKNKIDMVNFINDKIRKKWSEESIDPLVVMAEGVILDPDVLTIVFARRMTEYKRPYLILKDLKRLEKLINNDEKPIQIIFAGKAHPADTNGKKIIQQIFRLCEDSKFKGRLAFIEDYGEEVAKYLLKGADIWLNNPKLPLEACGTSGMKASVNGTLHLSTPDGWWPEGFNGKNGWKFGNDPSDDENDSNELYELLEKEIIPLYYDRDDVDYPQKWALMMREAVKTIAPKFSARRMMRDYYDKFYNPISKRLRNEM